MHVKVQYFELSKNRNTAAGLNSLSSRNVCSAVSACYCADPHSRCRIPWLYPSSPSVAGFRTKRSISLKFCCVIHMRIKKMLNYCQRRKKSEPSQCYGVGRYFLYFFHGVLVAYLVCYRREYKGHSNYSIVVQSCSHLPAEWQLSVVFIVVQW